MNLCVCRKIKMWKVKDEFIPLRGSIQKRRFFRTNTVSPSISNSEKFKS